MLNKIYRITVNESKKQKHIKEHAGSYILNKQLP